ncbi:MAG: hypothetical protein PHI85_02975 [Victivallaceae bacterium]|nr:hypothetical protein [Victivallaceae bacterium]
MSVNFLPIRIEPPVKMILARLRVRIPELGAEERGRIESEIGRQFVKCRFVGAWLELSLPEALRLAGESRDVAARLENCSGAVIFTVTAGARIVEAARREFADGSSFRAAVCDAVGSEGVEAAVDALELHLRQRFARSGLALGKRRFSPGYGDWPLEAQREFYRLLEMSKLGVELGDRLILCPEKTVTAMIGVTGNE